MKKYFLLVLFALIAFSGFAQVDSVAQTINTGSNFFQPILTFLEGKYVWIESVLAINIAVDHLLASSKTISASSTFQLIANFLNGIK